ncbi:hypothetical protein [Macromonas nakdongensis]|uniref:hypothetical protein n=1 Tax=Macromonas nakdongensis TaxID=1843082 RepID=UPI000C342F20|nr:hypothetical protein [Macromonas nakdongensis]
MLRITEFAGQYENSRGGLSPMVAVPGVAEQALTLTGSTQQSAAFNVATRLVRLHAQVACHVAFGDNPTATTSSMRLAEGQTEYFGVAPGHKLAVIQG